MAGGASSDAPGQERRRPARLWSTTESRPSMGDQSPMRLQRFGGLDVILQHTRNFLLLDCEIAVATDIAATDW